MNPIINPLWFYLISVAGFFDNAFTIIGIALIVIAPIIWVIAVCVYADLVEKFGKEDKDAITALSITKIGKKLTIIAAIIVTIAGLIPSEATCYKMMTASLITPDNISIVGENVKDFVDYTINSINSIRVNNEGQIVVNTDQTDSE